MRIWFSKSSEILLQVIYNELAFTLKKKTGEGGAAIDYKWHNDTSTSCYVWSAVQWYSKKKKKKKKWHAFSSPESFKESFSVWCSKLKTLLLLKIGNWHTSRNINCFWKVSVDFLCCQNIKLGVGIGKSKHHVNCFCLVLMPWNKKLWISVSRFLVSERWRNQLIKKYSVHLLRLKLLLLFQGCYPFYMSV